jgi:signal transduction histidine kinase
MNARLIAEEVSNAATAIRGPSAEMRRFSAGIRLVTALLCTSLLIVEEDNASPLALLFLMLYGAWAGRVLWMEATDRPTSTGPWTYWIDVFWSCATMKMFASGTMMMTVTLVHPVVLSSIGYGVTHGVMLALVAALGLSLDTSNELMLALREGAQQALPALLVLMLVPAAALLSRPMSVLRHRLALIDQVESSLDPRRGREAICAELVARLQSGTQSDVVVLVLPSVLGAPAAFATKDEGGFNARPGIHHRLEELLAKGPECACSYIRRRWWDLRSRTQLHGDGVMTRGTGTALNEVAALLSVHSLHVVPLTRYARKHGHFVIGYASRPGSTQDLAALSGAVPELLRIIEQASLVDQLQDESAGHERARIGRDLHDSAIQPYLGLKYAIECVALRIPPDNPARADVDALADLVNAEVAGLRELISVLRTGSERGDDALVPAVRRQVRRFGLLFGIEVALETPENLSTSRALAGAMFHMVNEVLNNIRKHTAARRVWVALSTDGSTIRLVVRDDSPAVSGMSARDFRPTSLIERAAELGGKVSIRQHEDHTAELAIEIPQ